jgi:hypothetical protein
MTPKQRLICALEGRRPDRLPVTTHHVMEYFLATYMGGISRQEFFERNAHRLGEIPPYQDEEQQHHAAVEGEGGRGIAGGGDAGERSAH